MDEYIEREKAFKLIKEQKEKETGAYSKGRNKGLIIAGSIINNKEVLPAADVAEVKHGHWIYNTDDFTPKERCSVCGYNKPMIAGENIVQEPNYYCNFCGAVMDERSDT